MFELALKLYQTMRQHFCNTYVALYQSLIKHEIIKPLTLPVIFMKKRALFSVHLAYTTFLSKELYNFLLVQKDIAKNTHYE